MAQSLKERFLSRGVWGRFIVIIPMLVLMTVVSRAYISSVGGTYVALVPLADGLDPKLEDVHVRDTEVVEPVSVGRNDSGMLTVGFRAIADGETEVTLEAGNTTVWWSIRVDNGTIVSSGVNFSGWQIIHWCTIVTFAVLAVLFGSVVVELWRKAGYGYEMVACGGGLLFCAFELVFFLALQVTGVLRSFSDFISMITYMADIFTVASLLPMAILAVLVSLSNISLIRHEGRRPVNLLGIAVSVLWILAVFLWLYIDSLSGLTITSIVAAKFLDSLIAVAITYGECLLLSTMACAWLASRHVPRHGFDYLAILGCGIRADGTPTPLLAGRVDRALAFDESRVALGDAPVTFVPSGGQGPDEVVSEAQSMAGYLEGKGVAPERIVCEGKSTTTRQNMAFSREVIERHAGKDASELAIGFCTTNYHVFRGYVCARQAGMTVEGMGSKTKYYFWPNAFLREFAGLLASQWKMILQSYVLLAGIYVFAEYALMFA